jgi:hypothetical protein
MERFSETLNPGYFLIKLAAVLLAVLVMLEAAFDLVHAAPHSHTHEQCQ